jgi:NADH-quinone oxidoreductase subunit J
MIAAIAFYVFATIMLASAALVVSVRNPVYAVLFLILAFFNAAGLFLLAGAEFLAMILVIVYVGAVAVLFLFVVMMLNVNFVQLSEGFQRYTRVGLAIGAVLFLELVFVLGGWTFAPGSQSLRLAPVPANLQNTAAIGQLLYTKYFLLFQTSGLILLVAMIGAIVLTLRGRVASKRQDITRQTTRRVAETLVAVSMPLGSGTKATGIFRPLVSAPAELTEEHHAPEAH